MAMSIKTISHFKESTLENFYGRKKELEILSKRIISLRDGYRQNIAITGSRLSGKTTLLQNLIQSLQNENDIIPIFIEVLPEDFQSFAERYIGTLLYSYFRIENLPLKEDFEFLVKRGLNRAPKTFELIQNIRSMIKKRKYDLAYESLLDLTTSLKEETGKRCIVVLDEFHNLEHFRLKNSFSSFGKKIMVQRNTMYIVASSKPTVIKRILSEKLSLLFGNFETLNLRGLDEATFDEIVKSRLGDISIERSCCDYIKAVTNKNPFYVSVIIEQLKKLATDFDVASIKTHHLVKVVEHIVFYEKGMISQYLLNVLNPILHSENSAISKQVLFALAKGARKVRDIAEMTALSSDKIRTALILLVTENIVYQNRNIYMIEDPMMEFWLSNIVYKRETSLMSSVQDMAEDFRQAQQELIESFVKNTKKEIFSKIVDLIKQFANDIIDINGKSIKLTKFDRLNVKCQSDNICLLKLKNNNTRWNIYIAKNLITEEDVITYSSYLSQMKANASKNILVALSGISENATLNAKNKKILIWYPGDLDLLTRLHNAERIIV